MRRASQILFLVGMILSIVAAVGCGISAIVCFVAGGDPKIGEMIAKGLAEAMEAANYNGSVSAEELAKLIQGAYIGGGIACLFVTGFAIANAVFSAKAKDGRPTRTISILCIVFGILSDVIVTVVGAVFALICDSREQNRKDVIDNKTDY